MNVTAELPSPLIPVISVLTSSLLKVQNGFNAIPGSSILIRYIRSSYQVNSQPRPVQTPICVG
jgi:hypothetical protein